MCFCHFATHAFYDGQRNPNLINKEEEIPLLDFGAVCVGMTLKGGRDSSVGLWGGAVGTSQVPRENSEADCKAIASAFYALVSFRLVKIFGGQISPFFVEFCLQTQKNQKNFKDFQTILKKRLTT